MSAWSSIPEPKLSQLGLDLDSSFAEQHIREHSEFYLEPIRRTNEEMAYTENQVDSADAT